MAVSRCARPSTSWSPMSTTTARSSSKETREWAGTRVDEELAQRLGRERSAIRLHQSVRLRVLQAR